MKPLSQNLNNAVASISKRLLPTGYDISTAAPDTYEKLRDYCETHGRPSIWPGASFHTIYADKAVNYAFRAWHDWCHWRGGFDFTPTGEAAAAQMQMWHLRSINAPSECSDILDAEIVGQTTYFSYHKRFPENQRGFVEAYLLDRDAALFWPLW